MASGFEGRKVLVTGGSRGIGKSIVLAFASQGASVAFAHLDDDAAAGALLDEGHATGGRLVACSADVAEEAAVETLIANAAARLGGLDTVISNAGILRRSPLVDMTVAEFDRIVAVNLRGTFLVGRAAARLMRESRVANGRIINMSSDYVQLGPAGYGAYAATKAGISALTRCWARELAPDILVNAVAPGPVDTDMVRAADISANELSAELAALPLRRIGRPEEIADIVLFLAGQGAAYITGQTFGVNGGSAMA